MFWQPFLNLIRDTPLGNSISSCLLNLDRERKLLAVQITVEHIWCVLIKYCFNCIFALYFITTTLEQLETVKLSGIINCLDSRFTMNSYRFN